MSDLKIERPETSGEVNQAYSDFLWDPTSRCIVCLGDEVDVKFWRDHPKHGRVFICGTCATPRREPSGHQPVPFVVVQQPLVEGVDYLTGATPETYAEEVRRLAREGKLNPVVVHDGREPGWNPGLTVVSSGKQPSQEWDESGVPE